MSFWGRADNLPEKIDEEPFDPFEDPGLTTDEEANYYEQYGWNPPPDTILEMKWNFRCPYRSKKNRRQCVLPAEPRHRKHRIPKANV